MNDMNPVASSRFMKCMPNPSTRIGDLRQNGTIAIRHFHSDLAADQHLLLTCAPHTISRLLTEITDELK